MTGYLQVVTVVGTKEDAVRISELAVEKRLAACSQVLGPIMSTYWWKRKVERAEEWMCLMKTQDDIYRELELMIRQNHVYEIPEILAFRIVRGYTSYLDWVGSQLTR